MKHVPLFLLGMVLMLASCQRSGTQESTQAAEKAGGVADASVTTPAPDSAAGLPAGQPSSKDGPMSPENSRATVAVVGQPQLVSDGKELAVEFEVRNLGGIYLTSEGANPVNLGVQLVDGQGGINTEFVRVPIPAIAPSRTATVRAVMPVDKVVDHTLRVLLVQEGVNWFDIYGNEPLLVGPFTACNGTVCGSDGQPIGK